MKVKALKGWMALAKHLYDGKIQQSGMCFLCSDIANSAAARRSKTCCLSPANSLA